MKQQELACDVSYRFFFMTRTKTRSLREMEINFYRNLFFQVENLTVFLERYHIFLLRLSCQFYSNVKMKIFFNLIRSHARIKMFFFPRIYFWGTIIFSLVTFKVHSCVDPRYRSDMAKLRPTNVFLRPL